MLNIKMAFLKKIIERIDFYIGSVNTKAAFIITFNSLVLGSIIFDLNKFINSFSSPGFQIFILLAVVCILIGLFFSYYRIFEAVAPFLKSGNYKSEAVETELEESSTKEYKTHMFFGSISLLKKHEYAKEIKELTEDKIIEDYSNQIHELAVGASEKFEKVKASIFWLMYFVLIPLFLIAIIKVIDFSTLKVIQNKNNIIKIGHISPLTGENARWGKWEKDGIDLAVDQINSNGGIDGNKIEVIHEDDQGDPKIAVTIMQKFINQGIQAVIGPSLSGAVLACAPLANNNRVVSLTPSAQSPKITYAGDYIFRIFASNSVEGPKLFQLAMSMNVKRVAILYANIEYGVGLYSVIKEEIIKNNITLLTAEAYDANSTDFRSQLVKIKNAEPDGIFLLGFPSDMAVILRQMKELNVPGLKFAPNSFEEEEIIDNSQGGAEGVYYVYPILSDSSNAKIIREQFEQRYKKEMNYYNGVGYDAVKVFEIAIKKVIGKYKGEISGENIKDELYRINYAGVSGPISFDSNGDIKDRPMEFRVVRNGTFTKINK